MGHYPPDRRLSRPLQEEGDGGCRGIDGDDGDEADGQHIPFKTTKEERIAAGDPRLSLEERYINHSGYVEHVTKAAQQLESERFLLPADVQKYIQEAQASNVLLP